MRVATLNLWGRSGDWAARRAVLQAGFQALAPDLVAFQESVVSDGDDQVVEVLGDGFHVVHQAERAPDGMGVSIASRWPIDAVHELDLHVTARTADFPCTTLVAEIDCPAPTGRVLFVNHFPSWQLQFEVERERQAVLAARFIEEHRGEHQHVVVLGDFDADPAATSVRFWTGRHSLEGVSVCYRDAWERAHLSDPGHTLSPPENPLVADHDWPFGRIDYVLVRCGEHGGPTLRIAACERIFDAPVDGVWASDHFGVLVDLAPH
jgi:endonuclease/exonuclease/phosphatase family metal-dependent hydrolase